MSKKSFLLFVPLDENMRGSHEFIPIGPLSIVSYLESVGQKADILHGRVNEIPSGYDFYGVSSTTNQYHIAKQALSHIKNIEPRAPILLGGPHLNAQSCIDICEKDEWNYLVSGEGELTCHDIIKGLKVPRISYGKAIQDLDSLPIPDFSKINISKYNFPLARGYKCINVMTSRGCPNQCVFCSTAGSKLRQRSPELVNRELTILKDKYGFDSFMFVDDTMSINRPRFRKLLSLITDLNIKWRSYGRTTALNREDLELMSQSGCLEVALGIESGSQRILNLVRKGTRADKNREFIHLCKDVGIRANAMVIVGLPGENRESIAETEVWMRNASPECFGYNIFFPFPDAPIWKEYESFYKNYITLYEYSWENAVTKANKIEQSFVSTPWLSREEILEEYKRNFNLFVEITDFDPRTRGLTEENND